jgi:hypothetical protein
MRYGPAGKKQIRRVMIATALNELRGKSGNSPELNDAIEEIVQLKAQLESAYLKLEKEIKNN